MPEVCLQAREIVEVDDHKIVRRVRRRLLVARPVQEPPPDANIADLLGVFDQFKPKFTKRYAQISDIAVEALSRYAAEVREGKFPDAEHSYGMKPEEQALLDELVARRKRG